VQKSQFSSQFVVQMQNQKSSPSGKAVKIGQNFFRYKIEKSITNQFENKLWPRHKVLLVGSFRHPVATPG